MEYLAVTALGLAMLTPTQATTATRPAEADDGPTATASVSKRYARRLLRSYIREEDPYLIPGSIIVTTCRRGYTREGWQRVYCHDIAWDRRERNYRTVCGWGKVVEKTSYFSYNVYPKRYC